LIQVLVVDDNYELCYVLSEIVNLQKDMTVCGTAHNGSEAIGLIRELNPDIVLLDLVMPEANGLKVLEQFYGCDEGAPAFIVISALGFEDMTEKAMVLGAKTYINKPCNFDYLLDSIRRVFLPIN